MNIQLKIFHFLSLNITHLCYFCSTIWNTYSCWFFFVVVVYRLLLFGRFNQISKHTGEWTHQFFCCHFFNFLEHWNRVCFALDVQFASLYVNVCVSVLFICPAQHFSISNHCCLVNEFSCPIMNLYPPLICTLLIENKKSLIEHCIALIVSAALSVCCANNTSQAVTSEGSGSESE